MEIVFTNDHYICKCTFDERHLPKDAGFSWDPERKRWYTCQARVAARLLHFCNDQAKKQLSRETIVVNGWSDPLSIPDHETLFPFQIEAAKFALSRNRSYLALDPGLGKTPIAAVVARSLSKDSLWNYLYICPPFLTRNTEAEFKRWGYLSVNRYGQDGERYPNVLIMPDSLIFREHVHFAIQNFITHAKINEAKSMIIVDEAHRFKNAHSKRTKALFTIAKDFDRQLYLSGTPMPNRPIELYTVLSNAAPEVIDHMSLFEYGRKYCAAHRNAFGWDFSGASNMDELQKRVKGTFMLRMRKSDVMKDLPAKTEEMVILEDDMNPKYSKLDAKILEKYSPKDLLESEIKLELGVDTLHLSTYRKELGIAKVESAIDFIKYYLEETEENLLVFAIHTEVIEKIKKELEKFLPLVITGSTPMQERHEIVKTFQESPSHRLFVGNIQAAGMGLTLTKATRVIFAEFSWVPADNEQASDRAHRIGQKDNVFVQYLVYRNSVDKAVIETILKKRKVTEKI